MFRFMLFAASGAVAIMVVVALGANFYAPAIANHLGGMSEMSLDMHTAGNLATSIGPRDFCAQLNENGVQDADESAVDTLTFDLTAKNIPPYDDNGTPFNYGDDTGGVVAYTTEIAYDESQLTIATDDDNFLLNVNPGSAIFSGSDPTPDTDANGLFSMAVIDIGSGVPEEGSGALTRLTISSESTAVFAAALYLGLSVTDSGHIDAAGAFSPADQRNGGAIALNQPCSAVPTPTPQPTPMPGDNVVGGKLGLQERDSAPMLASRDAGSEPAAFIGGTSVAAFALVAGAVVALRRRRSQ